TLVAHLTARFAVERGALRHHLAASALLQALDHVPLTDQSDDRRRVFDALVAREADAPARHALQRLAVYALHGGLRALELRALARLFERRLVACDVDRVAALTADHLRQIEREAI